MSDLNTKFHLVDIDVAKLKLGITIKETGRSITRMIKQFDKEIGRVGAIIKVHIDEDQTLKKGWIN